jgi:hypothetical protein
MKKIVFWEILIGIIAISILLVFLLNTIAEPWAVKKIESAINEKSVDYEIKIDNVDFLIAQKGIALNNITLVSTQSNDTLGNLSAEIESVKLTGVKIMKALFKKEFDIGEITVFNSRINGKMSFDAKPDSAMISPFNINIENLILDKFFVDVRSTTSPQSYIINEGGLHIYDMQLAKMDTISPAAIGKVEFNAQLFSTILSDSMYTISVSGVNYSANANVLSADTVLVHPNYPDAEFTARYTYREAHIDARLSQLFFRDFSAVDFINSGNIICSSVDVGKLDMRVLEDSRKEFSPENKTVFQEKVYNFPTIIDIDSIGVYSGRIVYSELVEKGNEPAEISFDNVTAMIYNMRNDTIYKTEKEYLEFKADALIMDKAKIHVELKGRLYDSRNTFELSGNLSTLEASEMNAILEKNTSVFASSGTIDAMYFNFTANNTKATGEMKLLYHGLKITAANKKTGDTSALKERLISGIANIVVMDANPRPGKDVRTVIIDFDRKPEAPFFDYCSKSLLSGIPPSLIKRHNKGDK